MGKSLSYRTKSSYLVVDECDQSADGCLAYFHFLCQLRLMPCNQLVICTVMLASGTLMYAMHSFIPVKPLDTLSGVNGMLMLMLI